MIGEERKNVLGSLSLLIAIKKTPGITASALAPSDANGDKKLDNAEMRALRSQFNRFRNEVRERLQEASH